jgi:hypothetical protein
MVTTFYPIWYTPEQGLFWGPLGFIFSIAFMYFSLPGIYRLDISLFVKVCFTLILLSFVSVSIAITYEGWKNRPKFLKKKE